MPRQGLSQEKIIEAAIRLMEEIGCENFTLKKLAEYLMIKPASLYNHIASQSELNYAIGKAALERLTTVMELASKEKEGIEAITAISVAYRKYAKENPVLYETFINIPSIRNELIKEGRHSIGDILRRILRPYRLTEEETIHMSRAIRSAMHGFISLENSGYFQTEVSLESSYAYMIRCLTVSLLQNQSAITGGKIDESTSN